nr:class I SAM-dependent methyltransferase [uncultured Sphingomonas sp.]
MNFVQTIDRRELVRFTGSVYTPASVAEALTEFVATILPPNAIRALEPSVGDGAFVDALEAVLPSLFLTAIDIDEQVIEQLEIRDRLDSNRRNYRAGDFLGFAREEIARSVNYDLIIGNPPFIRKHNFSEEFKLSLEELAKVIDYPKSNFKNSWAAFVIAAAMMLNQTGVLAFILPYEMMTVSYGQAVLQWLSSKLARIDLFISNEKAFPEIDQDAIIFVGRSSAAEPGQFVQRVRSMTSLLERRETRLDLASAKNLALELSSFLITGDALATANELRAKMPIVGDHCTSAPGIVTAANDYFILTEDEANELGILEHTLPILKKGSLSARQPIFEASDFEKLANREPCRLVFMSVPVEELPEKLRKYVITGEERGYNKRYKCRNRDLWYRVPLVPKAPAFVFKRSHEYPRLCLNEADVYITDTAYGLRMKDGFTDRGLCFSFYNSMTLLFAETDGRFYGGGVLELSPKEFRGLPLAYHEPSDQEFDDFLAVHRKADGDVSAILDFGDRWLAKKLRLSSRELRNLRTAWQSVRAHRLRHGRSGQPDGQ